MISYQNSGLSYPAASACLRAFSPCVALASAPGTGVSASGTRVWAQGAGVSFEGAPIAGIQRITVPGRALVMGSAVPAGERVLGKRPANSQQYSSVQTQATGHTFEAKHDVVVDDIPGVRTWSPPV